MLRPKQGFTFSLIYHKKGFLGVVLYFNKLYVIDNSLISAKMNFRSRNTEVVMSKTRTARLSPYKRLKLELSEQEMGSFDALIHECGVESRKEIFDLAMTLMHFVSSEVREGRQIASVNIRNNEIKIVDHPVFRQIIAFSTIQTPGP